MESNASTGRKIIIKEKMRKDLSDKRNLQEPRHDKMSRGMYKKDVKLPLSKEMKFLERSLEPRYKVPFEKNDK